MSNKNQAGGGCAALIVLGVAIVILAWAIKIGLIILGVALVLGGVLGGVSLIFVFWNGVFERPAAQAALDDFDNTLKNLSTESARRLSSAITAWDDLQRNRGVGTELEKTYFAESVDAATRELFEEVNFHMAYGEELLNPANTPLDRDRHIDHLHEQDVTTLHLDTLRRQVN